MDLEAYGSGVKYRDFQWPDVMRFLFVLLVLAMAHLPAHAQGPSRDRDRSAGQAAAIRQIYEAWKFERSLCPQIIDQIAKDRELIDNLVSANIREAVGVPKLLAQSSVSQSPPVRYLLEHPGYLVVDVDMHLGGGRVFLGNHGIFCAQTVKRLRELEALGPSEEAWEVRKPDILRLYTDLNFPSFMIGASYGVDIKDFADYLDEVKRLYRAPHHKRFLRGLVEKLQRQVEAALSKVASQSPRELAAEVYGSTFTESDVAEVALEKTRYRERLREWLTRLQEGL